MSEPDKYELAIRYLEENPEELAYIWQNPDTHSSGCVFAFATPTDANLFGGQKMYGCLTMIRTDPDRWIAWTPELTDEIANDDLLPRQSADFLQGCKDDPSSIRQRTERLVYWQRRLDVELNRV